MLASKNILERLRIDPGQRTLGELLWDREAALNEIRQLRRDIERLRNTNEDRRERLAPATSKATERYFQSGMLISISKEAFRNKSGLVKEPCDGRSMTLEHGGTRCSATKRGARLF